MPGTPASDRLSFQASAASLPRRFCGFLKWDKVRRGEDWDGVYSFNLNSKELVLRISAEKLRFSELHGRLSIAELVSLSEERSYGLCKYRHREKSCPVVGSFTTILQKRIWQTRCEAVVSSDGYSL
jgi:hypothetical protein